MLNFLGLTPLKLLFVAIAVSAALTAFAVYRQSLINEGWDRALGAVRKQDSVAKDAASRAQRTVDECYEANLVWSTITGKCTAPETKP